MDKETMQLAGLVLNAVVVPLLGLVAWFIRQWIEGARLEFRELREDHEARIRKLESGEQFKVIDEKLNQMGERLVRIETRLEKAETMRPRRGR